MRSTTLQIACDFGAVNFFRQWRSLFSHLRFISRFPANTTHHSVCCWCYSYSYTSDLCAFVIILFHGENRNLHGIFSTSTKLSFLQTKWSEKFPSEPTTHIFEYFKQFSGSGNADESIEKKTDEHRQQFENKRKWEKESGSPWKILIQEYS